MLSKPDSGWSLFELGNVRCQLSYVTDVAVDWMESAIEGLRKCKPFAVHGFLEPDNMICVVSDFNSHIFVEADDDIELDPSKCQHQTVHISKIEFCEKLYEDIESNFEDWVTWFSDDEEDGLPKRREELSKLLSELKEEIEKAKAEDEGE